MKRCMLHTLFTVYSEWCLRSVQVIIQYLMVWKGDILDEPLREWCTFRVVVFTSPHRMTVFVRSITRENMHRGNPFRRLAVRIFVQYTFLYTYFSACHVLPSRHAPQKTFPVSLWTPLASHPHVFSSRTGLTTLCCSFNFEIFFSFVALHGRWKPMLEPGTLCIWSA